MAIKRTVGIPKYISRPRLILTVEIDIIAVCAGVFTVSYIVLMPLLNVFAFIPAVIIGWLSKYVYEDIRKTKKLKGHAHHKLWVAGIKQPDLKKYPEHERMSKKNAFRFPYGIENKFIN